MFNTAQASSLTLKPIVRPVATALLLLLCATLWVAPASAAPSPVRQVPIDYSRMKDALRASGIPLHLPTRVVYALPPDLKRSFYGTKGGPNQDGGYEIYVGHPDCPQAALNCTIAIVSATPLASDTPSIEQAFPPLDPSIRAHLSRVSPDPQGWVTLATGQSVYFVPWVMGASMGFAQVVWDEHGYRYTIELKGGDRQWLLQMANSAFQ